MGRSHLLKKKLQENATIGLKNITIGLKNITIEFPEPGMGRSYLLKKKKKFAWKRHYKAPLWGDHTKKIRMELEFHAIFLFLFLFLNLIRHNLIFYKSNI